jgi:hypothetical protein
MFGGNLTLFGRPIRVDFGGKKAAGAMGGGGSSAVHARLSTAAAHAPVAPQQQQQQQQQQAFLLNQSAYHAGQHELQQHQPTPHNHAYLPMQPEGQLFMPAQQQLALQMRW